MAKQWDREGSESSVHQENSMKNNKVLQWTRFIVFNTVSLQLFEFCNFLCGDRPTTVQARVAHRQSSLQANRPSPDCQRTAKPLPLLDLKFCFVHNKQHCWLYGRFGAGSLSHASIHKIKLVGYFSQDLSYLYMLLYIVHTKALLLPVALTYSHIDTVLSHIIAPSDDTIMSFRWINWNILPHWGHQSVRESSADLVLDSLFDAAVHAVLM